MFIHLTPSFFLNYSDVSVELIDVAIPELGVVLNNNEDVTVRFPAPNKRLHYVCRKKGRKAMYGILLKTDKPVSDITVITRWRVQGEISVHRVHMHFEGDDNAASDCIQLWMGRMFTDFRSRTPACAQEWIPASCQPRLTVSVADRASVREPQIWRNCSAQGIIREQSEYFTAATIEPERLFYEKSVRERIPSAEDAFICSVQEYEGTVKHLNDRGFPQTSVCTIREQEGLIKEDLYSLGMRGEFDNIVKPILDEISGKFQFFFTNTNDLMNAAKIYSGVFQGLTDNEKNFFLKQVSVPLFEITFETDRLPQS